MAESTDGDIQWVEIIEPKTQQRMFANMTTGECLWDAPLGEEYKKMNSNQWWELYDVYSEKHYYYNSQTGETIWSRPTRADIIPLSKLQSIDPENGNDEDDDAFKPAAQPLQEPTSPHGLDHMVASLPPTATSPKTSVNGVDWQTPAQHTGKTSSLRHKLQEKMNLDQGQKSSRSISHKSPSPGPPPLSPHRRTVSSSTMAAHSTPTHTPLTETKDPSSVPVVEAAVPVAPVFTPKTKVVKDQDSPTIKRHSSLSGDDPAKPQETGRRKTDEHLHRQQPELHKFDNLAQHTRGIILKKKVSIANMLQWTKDPIKEPMIMTRDKQIKKECCELFKLVQSFMTDRKAKEKDENKLALDITTRAWEKKPLRDELYIQLCRQTTANAKSRSIERGWQLFTVALAFFPPSMKFRSYLEGYLWRHVDESSQSRDVPIHVYAQHCHKRVEKMTMSGAKRGLKKPSLDEIHHAKNAPFNPSMFGTNLEDVMEMQESRAPGQPIPWVVTTLANTVLSLQGPHTEGIFRVPGDIDEVNALKLHVDKWREPPPSLADPHVPASLLKLWFRELEEPLIPENFYQDCIDNNDHKINALSLVDSLPELNKKILYYLVNFLQRFTEENSSKVTRMGIENLAMVWAPNFLRCPSDDHTMIFQNTRKEMAFLRILLKWLDTTEDQ